MLGFIIGHVLSLFVLINILYIVKVNAQSDKNRAVKVVSKQLLKKISKTKFYQNLKEKTKFKRETNSKKSRNETSRNSDVLENKNIPSEKKETKSTTDFEFDLLKQRGVIENKKAEFKTTLKLEDFSELRALVEKDFKNFEVQTRFEYLPQSKQWRAILKKNINAFIESEFLTDQEKNHQSKIQFNLDY